MYIYICVCIYCYVLHTHLSFHIHATNSFTTTFLLCYCRHDALTQQKEKIGQHVWNLTDKLKSVSAQQEMTNKQHLALQADMEETISTHRKELDTRARQEGRIQATLEEKERLWTMEKEVLENALNEAKKENIESEQNARKLLERCETAEGSSKEMTGQNQQLRREVARVKERSASLQQDLQEERTALVTLRQQVRQQILLFYY